MTKQRRRQNRAPRPEQSPKSLPMPDPSSFPPGAQVSTSEELTELFDAIQLNIRPRLDELESAVGAKVIAFQIENAALADEQMLHLYEHLRRLGRQEDLGLWISSRGGATEVPWKIVSLLREFTKRFTVLVPYRAHSAATHVVLGADEIVMTEMSELGPVDPSRRHPLLPQEQLESGAKEPIPISVQDLRHVLEFLERQMGKELPPDVAATTYTALFGYVHPLAIGALEQSWALARQITEQVLSTHMDREAEADAIERIQDHLSAHYKSHLYQINRREARELGLKVRDATPEETRAMWGLYTAYTKLQISGQAQMGNEILDLSGIGHIDSTAGSTMGLAMARPNDPAHPVGSRWQSRWSAEPA